MERGVLIGVAGLRWAAWVWLTVVAVASIHRVHDPAVALAAVVATGLVTVATHAALRGTQWPRAMRPGLLTAELAVAVTVVAADGWVQQARITGQTLAGTWPLPAILVSAVVWGLAGGVGAGALLTAARVVAVVVAGSPPGQAGRGAVAALSTGVSWIVIGAVCGTIVRLLRHTQHQLATAEAREAIAHDLHDGVLQTLALIERRSDSPEIARLAREQERDLRDYLFGNRAPTGGFAAELRDSAARLERSWPDTRVTVTISDDIPAVGPDHVSAATGAVAEALTNAARHGHAEHIVVFADLDETSGGVFMSVKDDGVGFDSGTVHEGVGMARSIRGRIERVGGHVEFASSPGDGAEVRITLPPAVRRSGRHG